MENHTKNVWLGIGNPMCLSAPPPPPPRNLVHWATFFTAGRASRPASNFKNTIQGTMADQICSVENQKGATAINFVQP